MTVQLKSTISGRNAVSTRRRVAVVSCPRPVGLTVSAAEAT